MTTRHREWEEMSIQLLGLHIAGQIYKTRILFVCNHLYLSCEIRAAAGKSKRPLQPQAQQDPKNPEWIALVSRPSYPSPPCVVCVTDATICQT